MNLTEKCKDIRADIMRCIGSIGVGHVGGCLSIVEILVCLYYKWMNVDPANPKMEGRDRVVCSKGHAGPALYAVLADKGYFDKSELVTLNRSGTHLPSHCDMNKTVGIDMTAGSLGQGLSCAVGIALASKIAGDGATVYAIVGDGESQEGQIWEAAMLAAQRKLGNLIAFTDYNKMQIDGLVKDVNDVSPLDSKWRAFGWNVIVVKDGNDVAQVDAAIAEAKAAKDKPSMIVCNTIKGKGVSFIEAKGYGNHSMPVTAEDVSNALKELGR